MTHPTIINDGDIIVRDRMDVRAVLLEKDSQDKFHVWMVCAGTAIPVGVFLLRDEARKCVADICKQAGIELPESNFINSQGTIAR